jgi:hypothetical protein
MVGFCKTYGLVRQALVPPITNSRITTNKALRAT